MFIFTWIIILWSYSLSKLASFWFMWAWWVLFNIGGIVDVMIFIEILFNLQLISILLPMVWV